MLSWLIRNAITRPVTVIMLTILVLVLGLISIGILPVDFYPGIDTPKLTVATSYAGLPAKEVLELLTIPIEDSLSSLQGLRHMSSSSLDGISLIELKFSWGTDMKQASILARETADIAALRLPDGASKPMVLPVNPAEKPVIVLGVFPRENMDITELKKLCDREIRTIVQQAEGVGSIQILGGLDEEILVEPDANKISTYNLSPQKISEAIQATNIEVPAGSLSQGSMEYVIKTDATAKTIQDIENIYILSQNDSSSRIQIGDIATVSHSTNDRSSFLSQNGKEGVALLIRVQGAYSPVSLSKNIHNKTAELELAYGRSLDIRVLHDGSVLISDSIRDLILSAILGFIIAFAVIIIYMKDLSASLIMIASIPISLVMAIATFPLFHISINTMSIGGLAIGIGMLVDDSVVVLENVQRRSIPRQRETVASAALEIANSTIGSTLTSLIVFLPLFFLPGIIGAVFRDLAWAVCLSVSFSFIVSVTVIPVLYCYFGSPNKVKPSVGRIYRKFLRFTLRKPTLVYTISIFLLVFGSFCLINLEKDWLNTPASDEYSAQIAFPSGTTQDYLLTVSNAFSNVLSSSGFVKSCYFHSGGELDDPYYLATKSPESEILNCQLTLNPKSHMGEQDIRRVIKDYLANDFNEGVTISPSSLSFNEILGLSNGKTVSFAITGDRYETTHETALQLADECNDETITVYPNATRLQISVTPKWHAINRMGMSASAVADILGSSVFGIYAGSIDGKSGRIPIRVRFPYESRSSIDAIKGIYFPNASGTITPLTETVNISTDVNPPVYYRNDRQNTVYVNVPSDKKAIIEKLQKNYTDLASSEWKDQSRIIILLFSLSIFLMYVILGIQFDSFFLPILMLAIIPFGFAGVFIALFISHSAINLNSILGSLVVIGIIVRNGIIFYDHYHSLIKSTARIPMHIYRGANDRIRAITISFLTTLLALIPIALDLSGKNPQQTMAIAIIGGLLFSNFLSLFLFPIIYKMYFREKMRGA